MLVLPKNMFRHTSKTRSFPQDRERERERERREREREEKEREEKIDATPLAPTPATRQFSLLTTKPSISDNVEGADREKNDEFVWRKGVRGN